VSLLRPVSGCCVLQEIQALKSTIRDQSNAARRQEAALADQTAYARQLQVCVLTACKLWGLTASAARNTVCFVLLGSALFLRYLPVAMDINCCCAAVAG
jgi:hypothetical protein